MMNGIKRFFREYKPFGYSPELCCRPKRWNPFQIIEKSQIFATYIRNF